MNRANIHFIFSYWFLCIQTHYSHILYVVEIMNDLLFTKIMSLVLETKMATKTTIDKQKAVTLRQRCHNWSFFKRMADQRPCYFIYQSALHSRTQTSVKRSCQWKGISGCSPSEFLLSLLIHEFLGQVFKKRSTNSVHVIRDPWCTGDWRCIFCLNAHIRRRLIWNKGSYAIQHSCDDIVDTRSPE